MNSKQAGPVRMPEEADGTAEQQSQQVEPKKARAKAKATGSDTKEARNQAGKSKIDQLIALLRRQKGVSVAQLAETLGWQQHSVRGAMSGALKKRGLAVASAKSKGRRLYRLAG